MAVKIRLSRVGKKKAPCYRIVAVDSRKKRDGACLENLGTYNALGGKLVEFHSERVEYWVSQGAKLSDSVKKLVKLNKKSSDVQVKVAPKKVDKKKPEAPKKEAKA